MCNEIVAEKVFPNGKVAPALELIVPETSFVDLKSVSIARTKFRHDGRPYELVLVFDDSPAPDVCETRGFHSVEGAFYEAHARYSVQCEEDLMEEFKRRFPPK